MPPIITLASKNSGKIREFKQFLPEGWKLHDAKNCSDWQEDGSSFAENALIKAKHVRDQTGGLTIVVADDSGLEVDLLHGAPGVYSARFAGPDASDQDNNQKLEQALAGRSSKARFVCCLAVLRPNQSQQVYTGVCEGKVIPKPRGKDGFGYDPYFIPGGYDLTFAELDMSAKNTLSHRAKALKLWLAEELR